MIHRYEPGHGKGGEYMGMEEDPEGHWCAHEDVAPLEAALDQARGLLQREGTVMRDDPDHIEARQAWLRAHPAAATDDHPVSQDCVMLGCPNHALEDAPATPAATGAEPECGKCKALGPLAPCDGCYYGAAKEPT